MIDISSVFPQCSHNNCITVDKREKFIVIDTPSGKSEIFEGDPNTLQYPHFTIQNPNCKEIRLLAIDECIFFSQDGKKCDFAVYDEKLFCFVEIKLASNKRYRSDKKKDAIIQLKESISIFKQKLDFSSYRVEACLCVGYVSSSPRIKASNQAMVKYFIDHFDVDLFEGNLMEFI